MVWADAVDDEDDVQSNIIGDACADEFLRLNLQTPELLAHDSCWVLVRLAISPQDFDDEPPMLRPQSFAYVTRAGVASCSRQSAVSPATTSLGQYS